MEKSTYIGILYKEKGGTLVENSHHEIDKKHLAFWYACIDEEAPAVDMKTEVIMIQDVVKEAMKE